MSLLMADVAAVARHETMVSEGRVEEVAEGDGVTFVHRPILAALGGSPTMIGFKR